MKKLFCFLIFLSAMWSGSLFAQIGVSGELGLRYKSNGGDLPGNFSFSLIPSGLYHINSDFAVGAKLGITYTSGIIATKDTSSLSGAFEKALDGIKNKLNGKTSVTVKSQTTSDFVFHLVPFARYYALGNDRISVYFEAQLPLGFGSMGSTKTTMSDGKTTTTDGAGYFSFGIQVVPGVRVKLTEGFSLIASANIARIGFNYESTSHKYGETTITSKTTSFGLGVNSSVQEAPLTVGLQLNF